MKKPLLILSALSVLLLASCDNENTTNPEPLGVVTIKGAIVADLDEDDDADEPSLEKVPAGVAVYFIDDNSGATIATATTTADGYSAEIQVGGPRDITIVVGDFETSIKIYDAVEDEFVTEKAIYNDRESVTINGVVKGATYIQNIEINQPETLDF
jgi:hypothetical protein